MPKTNKKLQVKSKNISTFLIIFVKPKNKKYN